MKGRAVDTPLRILWHSGTPFVQRHYSVQTVRNVRALARLGHTMAYATMNGHAAGLMTYEGLPVYPPGRQQQALDVLPQHARHFGADLILTHYDPWPIPADAMPDVPWLLWFPVDCEPISPGNAHVLRHHAVTRAVGISRFSQRMAQHAGIDAAYVPHSVDTALYAPRNRVDARQMLGWPQDRFIVGMVAANLDYNRKAFGQQMAAVRELQRRHGDVLLYLHTNQRAYPGAPGLDLVALALDLGFSRDSLIFPEPYAYEMTFDEPAMVALYNAFDVLLSVSAGEGFGVPVLEAQACGTPVIVGAWSGTEELGWSGWQVEKEDSTPLWLPTSAYHRIPHIGAIVEALEAAYQARGSVEQRERARAGALPYDVTTVARTYWRPVLRDVAQTIRERRRGATVAMPAAAIPASAGAVGG